jgi:23S rRNA (adenine2503-C2)-methyltransferase
VELAVSLHAATDELRSRLVPINRAVPIEELMLACKYFVMKTGRRPTFEWALFRGINDSPAQAEALAKLIGGLNAHVNIIAGNQTASRDFPPSGETAARAFKLALENRGIFVTVRGPRGQEIEAGCGQLRSRHLQDAKPSDVR